MDPRGQPVYKEWSPWPGWILIVFWGTMVLAMALVAVSGDEARGQRILGAVVLGIVAIAVQWLVAGLSVRLYRDAIVMGHRLLRLDLEARPLRPHRAPGIRPLPSHSGSSAVGGSNSAATESVPGRPVATRPWSWSSGTAPGCMWEVTTPTGSRSASAPWPAPGWAPPARRRRTAEAPRRRENP